MIARRVAFHLLDFFIATRGRESDRQRRATPPTPPPAAPPLPCAAPPLSYCSRSQLCFIVFLLIPCIYQTESNGICAVM